MAERAQVTSVEAIEAFRANLIVYIGRARATLEEISGDVMRVRLWVQNDQRQLWERELRGRGKKLEEAQNELFAARLSKLQEATAVEYMAVQRTERAIREAEAKLAVLKKWDRELENLSAPLVRQVDALHHFLTAEMSRAAAHLAQMVKTLEAYADVARPGGASGQGSAAPSTGPTSVEGGATS